MQRYSKPLACEAALNLGNNPCQWPSIPAFPITVAARVAQYVEVAVALDDESRQCFLDDLVDWLQTPVEATVKWDGTNVGVGCCGTVFGRRKVIRATNEPYQKTSLEHALSADVGAVKRELISTILELPKSAEEACWLLVYGELMCNPNLYNYSSMELPGRWLPFGAMLQFSADCEFEFESRLRTQGFVYSRIDKGDDSVTLRLINCAALRGLLETSGLKPPAPVFSGSLMQMVSGLRDWMCSEQGEGVVVAPATQAAAAEFVMSKWKISAEPQAGNIKALKGLVDAIELDQLWKVMPPGLPQMLTSLQRVTSQNVGFQNATTDVEQSLSDDLNRLFRQKSAERLQNEHGVLTCGAVNMLAVKDAVKSAMTKFDSIDAYQRRGNLKEIRRLLVEEVLEDLEIHRVEGPGSRRAAEREVKDCVEAEIRSVIVKLVEQARKNKTSVNK